MKTKWETDLEYFRRSEIPVVMYNTFGVQYNVVICTSIRLFQYIISYTLNNFSFIYYIFLPSPFSRRRRFHQGLFNCCLRSGHFPPTWKFTNMAKLPKPNKHSNDPSSYRLIALLDVLGKAFERILVDRLRELLTTQDILLPFQYGFRPGMSTQESLQKLHTDASKTLNEEMCMLAAVERDFDKVCHEGLLHKLLADGVPSSIRRGKQQLPTSPTIPSSNPSTAIQGLYTPRWRPTGLHSHSLLYFSYLSRELG